jgi:esterase
MMRLFFRKSGTGPPLLILHGLYGSSDNWVSIAKSLSDNFTVYLPDLRNHGQSPHSKQHDYNAMKDDLHEMVLENGIKKFLLAGHSMGGKTAMLFASEWPEMVEGLLVADISPFSSENKADDFYLMHKTILETILSVDPALITKRSEAELLLSGKIQSEKIRGLILKNLERTSSSSFRWKINARALFENLDKIMDGFPRPSDQTIPITGFPVIFLKAADSSYIPETDYNDIYKLFPAAEIKTIANSGHWINVDRPDAFTDGILSLLNG